MAIDNELYRRMLEAYREWNEFEVVDRARNAGRLSPEEAWQQYADLWGLSVNPAQPQSELRLKRRLQE